MADQVSISGKLDNEQVSEEVKVDIQAERQLSARSLLLQELSKSPIIRKILIIIIFLYIIYRIEISA